MQVIVKETVSKTTNLRAAQGFDRLRSVLARFHLLDAHIAGTF